MGARRKAGVMADDALPAEAAELLSYWFDELDEEAWWRPPEHVDAEIRRRFLRLYETIVRDGVPRDWIVQPGGRLAAIIALDQLPRNLHRGDARAFASDDLALALAKRAIETGDEEMLDERQRIFLYVPFQHSEDKAMQDRSLELYRELGIESCIQFAKSHKEVIDRFGRFSHRNVVLGRETNSEEAEFLKGEALFW